MTVEIRVDPNQPEGSRQANDDRVFHFCCLGNFSGSERSRSSYEPRAVNRNSWNALFEELKPGISLQVELPRVDDLKLQLNFESLPAFNEKGLTAKVPILASLRLLEEELGKASKEKPIQVKSLLAGLPDPGLAGLLSQMASSAQEEKVIDLLDMVDIGEESDDGPNLPETARLLASAEYRGEQRARLVAELVGLRRLILDQIRANTSFAQLHACWRALKLFLPIDSIKLSLIDCRREEWCDATFLQFVKPESGVGKPLDLAFYCEELGSSEEDRHIQFHLSRMAEFLNCPLILNASLELFDCKVWPHLSHLRDISGRLSRPQLIKWRKLRDEPGAGWLFLATNPFRLDNETEDSLVPLAAPPCFYMALLVAESLKNGKWPAELLHPGFQLPIATQCLARLDDEQGYDLSFEGLCSLSGKENGDRLYLLGMLGFGSIQIPAREQLNAASLVEFSLPYRFYAGCLSRFLHTHACAPDLEQKLAHYAGLTRPGSLEVEMDEGQKIFRIKPGFTIFGQQPDLILAL